MAENHFISSFLWLTNTQLGRQPCGSWRSATCRRNTSCWSNNWRINTSCRDISSSKDMIRWDPDCSVYSVNQRLVCFVATHGYSHTTGHQEMEQMQGYNQRLIEEMKNRQAQERARLPKIQRSEAKTRMAMFKKSLRITGTGTPEQDREKIKQVRPSVRKLC